MNEVYQAEVQGVKKWCCAYVAGSMPAPGFYYYDTRREAENCLLGVFGPSLNTEIRELEVEDLVKTWVRIQSIGDENIYFLFEDGDKIRQGFCKVSGHEWGRK